MWLLLLLSDCKKFTKLPRKLFINNPDLEELYTNDTNIVTPPENIRRQGCGKYDDDNLEAIKRYFDVPEAGQAAEQETLPAEVTMSDEPTKLDCFDERATLTNEQLISRLRGSLTEINLL